MPSSNLEKRLAALEQRRTGIQAMNILFGNAGAHFGIFRVTTGGGRVRYEQRLPGEPWKTFQKRMDEHVTGVLRLATFMPVSDAGDDLLYTPEEYENS